MVTAKESPSADEEHSMNGSNFGDGFGSGYG
jgi:hypothetical protein